ncbi:HEAT repeat domain-containing protein [Actinomadura oligospora]|uniref:HEAT repeat domain-containing protein n=1 Tax=Actinomadura oligospora TaxID=111804 RepID=UPI00047D09E7|nr:HEAT repeat domain-containing protein [Actinomadura oligospora]
MSVQRFEKAMTMMRAADPQRRVDGFDFLREHADAYVPELAAEFEREPDQGLRCWLLELLAEARSPEAMPVLTVQLANDDESLRLWAVRGLEMLDSREAHAALDAARANGWIE